MHWAIDRIIEFFVSNIPPWHVIAIGGPIGLGWAFTSLYLAGMLKRRAGLRTGYTRKIFHFAVFTTVALVQWRWGTPAVCLFGGMTTLVVFYAVVRGPGNMLYEAMAREKDNPHRTHYILVPYFATLLGGLVSNILFGPIAVVGYLVTGLGDAVGEPVGTRFGRHVYKVPSLTAVKASRSWEGSTAVLFMSAAAVAAGIAISPELSFQSWSLLAVPLLALACAAIEAVSPHGWDNATMQLLPTALAALVL